MLCDLWETPRGSPPVPFRAPMSTHRYEHEKTITGLKDSITTLEFSPDGKTLASGCEDGTITIFSALNWKPLQMFVGILPLTSLAWHPRVEGLLFCGFNRGDVYSLRTSQSQVIPENLSPISNSVLKPSYRRMSGSGQMQTAARSTAYLMTLD